MARYPSVLMPRSFAATSTLRTGGYLPVGTGEVVHNEARSQQELEASHSRRAEIKGVLNLAAANTIESTFRLIEQKSDTARY
jgi:hypothetical protein